MIGVDYAILGILLISSFISLVRGFVKEALSLVGWIMAFWISLSFAVPLSRLLEASMEDPTLRLILAFVVLFILTLIVSAVVNFFASRLVQRTGLTGTDRFLGVLFGFLRGALLVSVLVLLAGLTTLPKEAWWDDSFLLFRFQAIAMWIRELLPADVDMFIPHQANMRIMKKVAERLEIPTERVYINIERYGNTSSASIPLALDEANRSGRLKKGDLVLLDAFGGGFTWGAVMIRW